MNFSQFLNVLRARKIIALLSFFITVGTTLLVTMLLPKSYEAVSTLVVSYTGADPVTGNRLPAQLMPGYMATQVDVIKSRKVALKVVDKLGLATNSTYVEAFYKDTEGRGEIRNWIADSLLKDLSVIPSRESSVLLLSYESVNAEFAAIVANAFSKAYIEANLELKIEPSQRTAELFREQIKDYRDDLIVAQKKLSDYQKEKGIVSIDERLDVESSRLSQLSQQLVLAQSELLSLESRRNSINKASLEGSSSELVSDPIIRDLKIALATSEVKLNELKQRLSSKHPDYIAAKSEVSSLREKFNMEIKLAVNRIDNNVVVAQQRVREAQALLDSQKDVLLEINDNRNMLDILTRDVEDAQTFLSVITQRLSQIDLEGQSKESDISILNQAVAPIEHTKPKVLINTILSVFLGAVLAVAFSLLFEMMDRLVRSKSDLEEYCDIPVLSVVSQIKIKTV